MFSINEISKEILDKFIKDALEKHMKTYIDGHTKKSLLIKHIKDQKKVKEKKLFDESVIKEEEPTNVMGNSSSSQGPIQTFDPLLGNIKKIIKRKIKKKDVI
jgi:hypothetical protein